MSIDCGGEWGVTAKKQADTAILTLPDAIKPMTHAVFVGVYPKSGFASAMGIVIEGNSMSVRNRNTSDTAYYAADFCYPIA